MITVLIAVYNRATFLPRCLDSILSQTWSDWEAICVDDCSTDNSLAVLNDYARRDERIKVVHLEKNQGQAVARNKAVEQSRGNLTAFLDSDDWIENDVFEKVEKVFQQHDQTDCVLLNVLYDYPDGHIHSFRSPAIDTQPPFTVMTGYDAFVKSLTWDVHGWYVARSELYRRFPFDTTCHSYSDDNTTMAHYLHSREVRWCDARYHFVQHDDSCTHGISIRRFDWLRANESLHRQLKAWNIPSDIINLYEAQRYYNLLDCHRLYLRHKKQFTPDEQSFIERELHHAWQGIDTGSLPFRVKYKPAYMPLHPFWRLFCLQQQAYHLFRSIKPLTSS